MCSKVPNVTKRYAQEAPVSAVSAVPGNCCGFIAIIVVVAAIISICVFKSLQRRMKQEERLRLVRDYEQEQQHELVTKGGPTRQVAVLFEIISETIIRPFMTALPWLAAGSTQLYVWFAVKEEFDIDNTGMSIFFESPLAYGADIENIAMSIFVGSPLALGAFLACSSYKEIWLYGWHGWGHPDTMPWALFPVGLLISPIPFYLFQIPRGDDAAAYVFAIGLWGLFFCVVGWAAIENLLEKIGKK